MTVDIGDDEDVGVVSLSSSSGRGNGYSHGERKGGVDREAVGMEQKGMGNGQPQLTNGYQRSVGNGQQQQGMDRRQLGLRMGCHQLGNGMGHQRSTNGMQRPGHQPQHGIKARNGVGRSQEHGLILVHQQQNTGLDPRRQQHAPQ